MVKTKRRISQSGTLQALQKENRRLINEAESRKELVKIGEERLKLAQQNKRLLKQLRRSPTNVAARRALGIIGRGSLKASKLAGRGFFRASKSVGKNLVRYGRFLNEQEMKANKRVRKIKKVSRRKSKKK